MTDYQDLLRRLRDVYSKDILKNCEDAADALEALLKEREELRGELEAFRENSGVVFYDTFDESTSDTPPSGGWDKPI